MKTLTKLILIALSAATAVALVGCGVSKNTTESTHYERDDTTEVYTVDTAAHGAVEQLSSMSYYAITAQPIARILPLSTSRCRQSRNCPTERATPPPRDGRRHR